MAKPTHDVAKMLFWNLALADRFNKRVMGTLRGKARRKTKRRKLYVNGSSVAKICLMSCLIS
jgi:hypothetical protein